MAEQPKKPANKEEDYLEFARDRRERILERHRYRMKRKNRRSPSLVVLIIVVLALGYLLGKEFIQMKNNTPSQSVPSPEQSK